MEQKGGPENDSSYPNHGWGVTCQYLDAYSGRSQIECIYRITPEKLAELDASTFNLNGDSVSASSSSGKKGNGSQDNMSDFYYNGIPDGKYSVSKGILELIIDCIGAIFDFIIGLLTMVIRMVFVGWTAIFENLATFTVEQMTGGDDFQMISVTSTNIDSGDNITIEKIVFNEVAIFDVNFFNFNDRILEENLKKEEEEKQKKKEEEKQKKAEQQEEDEDD